MAGIEGMGFENVVPAGEAGESGEGGAVEAPREKDPGRIAEDSKRAKQVRQQIQKARKENALYAELLRIIIIEINDINILKSIILFIGDGDVSVLEVFKILLPFLKTKINDENILQLFQDSLNIDCPKVINFSGYVNKILKSNEKLLALDNEKFIGFLVDIIYYFDVGGVASTGLGGKELEDFKQKLFQSLKFELYG